MRTSANIMKAKDMIDEMRPHYDFDYSKGVRGKYFWQLVKSEGRKVVVLDQDVAKAFPTMAAVNEALRGVMKAQKAASRTKHPREKA